MASLSEKIASARTAEGKDLWHYVKESNPEIITASASNKSLTEDMAVHLAESRHTPQETLGALASDARFKDSKKLKLRLARNPKTPQRVAMSLLKFLSVFELGDLTRDRAIPVMLRQKVEQSLLERIAALPSGVKSALARRASDSVVVAIMERGDRQTIETCLESPALTEGHLYKLIQKASTRPILIKAIAGHSKWSIRYDLRFSLLRNFSTPLSLAVTFLPGMKTTDLKYLYADPKVPASTKPFIHRELIERGHGTAQQPEDAFEIDEEEDPLNIADTEE